MQDVQQIAVDVLADKSPQSRGAQMVYVCNSTEDSSRLMTQLALRVEAVIFDSSNAQGKASV